MAAVLIGGFAVGASGLLDRVLDFGLQSSPSRTEMTQGDTAPTGERNAFGLCEWGGGRNCVVDGDTIYLNGVKIRIAGIDAPETHDLYQCPEELALGRKATVRLQQLLSGGTVSLSPIDRDEDVYGRKLRNVAVDGRDVGDVLVSEGLARPYRGFKMGWC